MRLLSLGGVEILLGRSRRPASRDTSTSLYVEMLTYYRVHSAGQEARMSRAQGYAGATAFSQNSALPKDKIHYF
jgi:hypothetical protein